MKVSLLTVKNPQIFFAFSISAVLLLTVFFRLGIAGETNSKQSLEISPPSQEVKSEAGTTIAVKSKIRNRSDRAVKIRVRIEDFTSSGQEGQVAFVNNGSDSLTNWTVLDIDSFSLRPNESKEVLARVTLPEDVAGGHYGSFVFAVDGGDPGPNAAALSQELASLFLVRVGGAVSEELIMTDLEAPKFAEFGPIPFVLKFKNSGNVHLKPFGLLNVRNIFGKTVKDIVVRGETNIFPGASRVIRVSLDDKYLIGPYTVQALINYGEKNNFLTMTTTFFAFPARILVVILLVIFILYKGRKRIVKAYKALAGK